MAHYKLSQAADEDFENIFDYGIDTFGLNQALKYNNSMKHRFNELAEQPELYPAVDDIHKGYRRSVFGSHSIYYRIETDTIIVMRILKRQDLNKAFGQEDSH